MHEKFPVTLVWIFLLIFGFLSPSQHGNAGEENSFTAFPLKLKFPQFLADPYSRNFSAYYSNGTYDGLYDTSSDFIGLKMGAEFGLLEYSANSESRKGFQLTAEGGFNGIFDAGIRTDNLGWNGFYAISTVYGFSEEWVVKFGHLHLSSHVGDEFMERTGHKRIDYTREEVIATVSCFFPQGFRLYALMGYGLRNASYQKPWGFQLGAEYIAPTQLWKLGPYLYAAIDNTMMQELGYYALINIQAGILQQVQTRRWRYALGFNRGNSDVAEFFNYDLNYFYTGVFIDV